MEAIVCDNFLKTTERAHASTKLTLRPGCSWSDMEFFEKSDEAGWSCSDQSFWNDYLHLSRKAEMIWLLSPSMGLPHALCGTVPDGSKGCCRICPLTSGGIGLQWNPSFWEGPAAVNTCWCLESCNSGLCWFGPTYLMVLGFDAEGTG